MAVKRGDQEPLHRTPLLSPRVVDTLVTLVAVVIPLVLVASQPIDEGQPITGAIVIGSAIAIPLVLFRRRWPIPLTCVAVVTTVVMLGVTGERTPVLIAVVVLLYTVATTTDRRVAWCIGLGSMLTLYTAANVFLKDAAFGPEGLATIAWTGLAVAAGDAVRSRREYVAAIEDRARRAEESREDEARRQVAEERLRIARELHDVVAHRMVVINVQAAAAASLLRREPDEAEAALEAVRSSASTVIDELGGLLNVLRTADEDTAPVEPAPTLRDVDALVRSFATGGLEVKREFSGRPRAVNESVQLAAYRVVQEALTNVHKHGSGGACLRIAYTPSDLEIDIENQMPSVPDPGLTGSGLGLVGMQERVVAVGGTVEAGPTDDGRFRVAAHLPIMEQSGE